MSPTVDEKLLADEKLRAWWAHRQGLDGGLAGGTPAEVLDRAGRARSVGGAAPYLTLFARAGIRREEADRALADLDIHELPAARGCTYVLPQKDFALGLRAGQQFAEAETRVARKLGVTDDEIARLSEAILTALKDTPLDPEGLRKAVGTAARSLGPEGVKKGIATTLPLALGLMQVRGEIRRVPVNGRLDQQRYKYALWDGNPPANRKLTDEESFIQLAHAFFRWTGAATIAEFQWFSGLGLKATKAAADPLQLEALSNGYLQLPEDREAFEVFRTPSDPYYALVGSLDSIAALRRSTQTLMTDEVRRPSPHALIDLPDQGIFDRGRVIGFWQFDPVAGRIVSTTFIPANKQLEAAIDLTEDFIREDLEDFRSFSLDSPKSRIPCIEALREGCVA